MTIRVRLIKKRTGTKYINIKAQPKESPPEHNNMFLRRVVDDFTGSNSKRVSLGYMEPNGEIEIHEHNMWELAKNFWNFRGKSLYPAEKLQKPS